MEEEKSSGCGPFDRLRERVSIRPRAAYSSSAGAAAGDAHMSPVRGMRVSEASP